jgi:hypothetical protein
VDLKLRSYPLLAVDISQVQAGNLSRVKEPGDYSEKRQKKINSVLSNTPNFSTTNDYISYILYNSKYDCGDYNLMTLYPPAI